MSDVKGPLIISFDITNKCNYRCLHCYNNSGENERCKNELNDEEILDLMKQIINMGPFSFCFCGGEPLLRIDLLYKCLELLTSNDINCAMVTNGFYLTDEVAKKLKEKGIRNVQISLDGDMKSHNRLRNNNLAYDRALQALSILKNNNIVSGIAFSPTKWNINDFNHVCEIGEKYGVYEIRLQDLMPIGRAKYSSILPSEKQYRVLRQMVYSKNIEYYLGKITCRIECGDPIDHLVTWSCKPISKNRFTESISILADGSLTPSVYLPITFGNIRKHTLLEYWEAGLERIWESEDLMTMSQKFTDVMTMEEKVAKCEAYIKEKYGLSEYDLIDLKGAEG